MRTARLGTILLAATMLAACGGGGGGGAALATGGHTAGGTPAMTLKVTIPNATTTMTAARKKHPAFVPASVQSIVYAITNGGANLVTGPNYTNVASSTACTAVQGAIVCTIAVPASISASGTYTVSVGTYDATQSASCLPSAAPACSGNLISLSSLPQQINVGSPAPLALTLGGVPAYFLARQLSGLTNGNSSMNGPIGFSIYGKNPVVGQFELLDAHGDVITDPGAPVPSVSISPAGQLSGTVTEAGGLYTLTLTPGIATSAEGPVALTGSYQVNLSFAFPNISPAPAIPPFPLTVSVLHSVVYAASCPDGCAGIDGFFDGNTTPGIQITGSTFAGDARLPIAADAAGNLYVADPNGSLVSEYPAPQPDTTPAATATIGISAPQALAVDNGGHVYVAFCSPCSTAPVYGVNVYNQGAFGSASGTLSLSAAPAAIAVDQSGTLYVSPSGISNQVQSYVGMQPGTATALSLSQQTGIAVAPAASHGATGDLWVAGLNGTAPEIDRVTPGSTVSATITAGVPSNPLGIAVDALGAIYLGSQSFGSGVMVFSPPSYSATTPYLISAPSNIAVVPAANVSDFQGINPNQTPVPIPTSTP